MLEKFLVAAMAALAVVVLAVVLGALFAFPVMWLWNGVLPNLFATDIIKPINFWNAWGLLILCGLLFKGSSVSSK